MTATNGKATWPQEELALIGAATEIGLASRRPDGSLRPYVYHAKYDRGEK